MLCGLCVPVLAQFSQGVIFMIDGKFYDKMPASFNMDWITGMDKTVDEDGNVFCKLYLREGARLDSVDVYKAIPEDKIPHLQEIRKRLETKVVVVSKPKNAIVLLNGVFFSEMPPRIQYEIMDVHFYKDTNGCTIPFYYWNGKLEEEDMKYALPSVRVEGAEEMLALYRTPDLKKMRIQMRKPKELLLKVGDELGHFNVQDVSGRQWTQQETLGKPLVLNFWYTGCGPCILEMPELSTWLDICPEANYFAVTWNTAEQIRKIVANKHFLFTQIADDKVLWKRFGVEQTPTTVLIDKKGVVRKIEIGTNERKRKELLECLKNLEKEK